MITINIYHTSDVSPKCGTVTHTNAIWYASFSICGTIWEKVVHTRNWQSEAFSTWL